MDLALIVALVGIVPSSIALILQFKKNKTDAAATLTDAASAFVEELRLDIVGLRGRIVTLEAAAILADQTIEELEKKLRKAIVELEQTRRELSKYERLSEVLTRENCELRSRVSELEVMNGN